MRIRAVCLQEEDHSATDDVATIAMKNAVRVQEGSGHLTSLFRKLAAEGGLEKLRVTDLRNVSNAIDARTPP